MRKTCVTLLRLGLAIMIVAAAAPTEARSKKRPLRFDDFWTILGLKRDAKPKQIKKALGPRVKKTKGFGDKRTWNTPGVAVHERKDGALQVMIGPFYTDHKDLKRLRKRFPKDPSLSLIRLDCKAAADRLDFAKEIKSYTTCKHYTREWLLHVTLMCQATKKFVTSVVVVYYPIDPSVQTDKKIPDRCK